MERRLLNAVVALALLASANAATYYVTETGSGSKDGSDWNNAYAGLPATLDRGATYYMADGSYGSYTFNTPADGSKWISIKKAIDDERCNTIGKTVLECRGTDAGWVNANGAGQARFSSMKFLSSHYLIDGQAGGGYGSWDSGHGFYIFTTFRGIHTDWNYRVSNIIIRHLEIEGHGPDGAPSGANDLFYLVDGGSDWHLSNLYLHDAGRVLILTRRIDNVVLENSYLARHESVPAEHSEAISDGGSSNWIIKNNIFEDGEGTGSIVLKKNSDTWTNNNWSIFGNVFYFTPGHRGGFGNGVICDTSGGVAPSNNMKVYNNVFVNLNGNGGVNWVLGSNNSVYNNIWYNNHYQITFRNALHDYNWFYNNYLEDRSPIIYLDDKLVDSEPNSQKGTVDPFVDWQNMDFRLKGATDPGLNLGSGHTDMLGNIRGSDGVWDRGALEFVSGACQPSCSGRECGPDGCGGTCGTCEEGYNCQSGQCEAACIPNWECSEWGPCTGGEQARTCTDTACGGSRTETCSCSEADTDCDGCISQAELMAYIRQWKTGNATLTQLMEAISIWKEGC